MFCNVLKWDHIIIVTSWLYAEAADCISHRGSICCRFEPSDLLASRRHKIDALSRANYSLQRCHTMARQTISCLSAIRLPRRLRKTVAAGPVPPVAEKTSGVKVPFSTSLTRSP